MRALGAALTNAAPDVTPAFAAGESGSRRDAGLGALRALLADDNLVNQKVAVRALAKWGVVPTVVQNGVAALAAWTAGEFDVVLMDCLMPELDGYETTRRIREAEAVLGRPHTRIIAMTANAMPGDRERCADSGMDDYVSKPLIPADLLAALRRRARAKV